MHRTLIAVAVTLSMAAGSAHAATANGSQFTNGLTSQTIDGIAFTAVGGSFEKKAAGPLTGVGIRGRTTGEIDIGEAIEASFAGIGSQRVASFTLGLLYNGPEHGDMLEAARIVVNGSDSYVLRTTATDNVAAWWHGATMLRTVNYTYATTGNSGAVVQVDNPFGRTNVDSLRFEATAGENLFRCGANGISSCTNPSDYNLVQLVTSPIPEPGTYALMAAGLAAVGFVARRRRG